MQNLTGWQHLSLEDVVDVLTGYAFPSKHFNEEAGIPLIRIRDLKSHDSKTLYDGEYDDKYMVYPSDILVGMDGEFNIVKWKGPKALLNQRVAKLSSLDHRQLLDDFLYYRLGGELKKIEAKTPSTTVKHLAKKDIHNLVLMVPPVGEQAKVSEILSTVDEAIEKTEAITATMKRARRGVIRELLTRGIGHNRFKQTTIGEIPEAWDVSQFKDVLTVAYGKSQKDVEVEESDIPILGTGGVIGWSKEAMYDQPSVLIGRKGTIDKPQYMETPFWTIDTLFYTKINESLVIPKFIYYVFQTINWLRYNEATGVPSLSATNISTIRFAKPSLEEQAKIVATLTTMDEKIEQEERKAEMLSLIKQGLLQVLLTGKIRVTPDNEEVTI